MNTKNLPLFILRQNIEIYFDSVYFLIKLKNVCYELFQPPFQTYYSSSRLLSTLHDILHLRNLNSLFNFFKSAKLFNLFFFRPNLVFGHNSRKGSRITIIKKKNSFLIEKFFFLNLYLYVKNI